MLGRDNVTNREDWLQKILIEIPEGLRILDAGAGELRNKDFCCHLNYVSQDFCQYDGKGDDTALQTGNWDISQIDLVSDITAIPAPDASFDVVLCTEVLEHVPDPIAALRELVRLVKPGGYIILTAPCCSLVHFAPHYYSSGFSRYWYETHLVNLGFILDEVTPNGGWLDYIAQEIWRLPWIGQAYSSKILGLLALLLALPLISVMCLMKYWGIESSDLLTFGWQVVAKKLPLSDRGN